MKLHRFAMLHFKPRPIGWESWSTYAVLGTRRIEISTTRTNPKPSGKEGETAPSTGLLVKATTELDEQPELDDKRRVIVPTEVRESCEDAIEHVANLISVLEGCSRYIASPTPCVALECTESELAFLNASTGIKPEDVIFESGARMPIPRSDEISNALADRMHGVALLAEAYSGGGEASKYRDFVRFFELAFGMGSSQLGKKLTQFLSGSPMGYTRQEIDDWLSLRDPLSHADFRKSKFIADASDVRKFIMRMEQACVDVLFNKAEWTNPSRTRRHVWAPTAISTTPTGNLVIKKGTALSLRFRVFDEFGVYPRDLGASIGSFGSTTYTAFSPPDKLPAPPDDPEFQGTTNDQQNH